MSNASADEKDDERYSEVLSNLGQGACPPIMSKNPRQSGQ